MKETRSSLIYLLAGVGIAALFYGAWIVYQQQNAQQQTRTFFSATPEPGIPDASGTPRHRHLRNLRCDLKDTKRMNGLDDNSNPVLYRRP